MSLQHLTTRSAIAAEAAAAEAEDYMTGRRNWRVDLRPAPDPTRHPTWDRPGVEALVQAGADAFTAATGVPLPYNLAKEGEWSFKSWPSEGRIREVTEPRGAYQCLPGTSAAMVAEAAKFGGFLRGISGDPMLVELVRRCTSPRGCGSPATTTRLNELAKRWTPGALSRQARQVRARANEILRPYGLRVSWRALGATLERGPRRTGKAAIWAAAHTLGWDAYQASYAEARNWLASVSRTPSHKARTDDGVTAFVDACRAQTINDVTVIPVWWGIPASWGSNPNAGGLTHKREPGFLCLRGTEAYHEPKNWSGCARDAARRAIYEWGQRYLARLERIAAKRAARAEKLAREERLRRVSVLVRRDDSYRAGHCRVGTDAFACEHGWANRWYVTDDELLATGDSLAANVAAVAQRAVLARMEAAE